MNKVLTIAIPAYNSDWCLSKCLDSLMEPSVLAQLDILVVDDGSTDQTADIARRYAERHPESIRLHSKVNGGHGSAINAAIDLAQGRYFKVVDSDDWVDTQNLPTLIQTLSATDANVVLTHFHTVDMVTGRRQAFTTKGIALNKVHSLEDMVEIGRDAFECSTFHGIFYNTEFYRGCKIQLTEKIFFEDHEYATLPFAEVKTVLPMDLFFYEYLVGNVAQSVSDQSQVKRIGHIEQVIWSMANRKIAEPTLGDAARQYFNRKMADMLLSYYIVALVKHPDREVGRKLASDLREAMQKDHADLIRYTDGRYRMARWMNRLGITNSLLETLKHSMLYKTLYKAVRKR